MRLFYGLALPQEIRAASFACAQTAAKVIDGRYAPASNHHITLAFLGDVPQDRIPQAQDILSRTVSRLCAPVLTLGDTGYFGQPQNGILIIHIHAEPSLLPLHDALIHSLRQAQLPVDPGPFSPHITLARHARIGDTPLPKNPPLSFAPDCAHLFLSARNAENQLTYTPVYSASFRAAHI